MNMTPARRDFLRLTAYNDLLISRDVNRFETYHIEGLLKKRTSSQNIIRFITSGYLTQIDNLHRDFMRLKPTRRTFKLFDGMDCGDNS